MFMLPSQRILQNVWLQFYRSCCSFSRQSVCINNNKLSLLEPLWFGTFDKISLGNECNFSSKARYFSRADHQLLKLCKKLPFHNRRHFVTPPSHFELRSTQLCDESKRDRIHFDHSKEDGVSNEDSKNNDDVQDSGGASHVPVMVEEVLQMFQPKDEQIIVDMTFGAGGHAQEILKIAPNIRYFASDRDPVAYSLAEKLAAQYREEQIVPMLSRFSEVPSHLHLHGVEPGTVDAFLFDLGASSMQFDTSERGFAISKDGPLDMRMDGNRFPNSPTAADVVNTLSANDLTNIFKKYGEEKKAQQIAHAIVEARYAYGNFATTKQLAGIISSVFHSDAFRQDKMSRYSHMATKCFQALRIFVNNELNELHNGLELALRYLRPGGCCTVISFHSLEDRIVKRHFLDIDIDESINKSIRDHFRNSNVSFDPAVVKEEFLTKPWLPVTRKVQEPTEEECLRNPRARSAKLRAALKQ